MQDELNDIFSTWPGGPQSPSASPRRNDSMSQQGSPGDCGLEAALDQQNPLCSVPSRVSLNKLLGRFYFIVFCFLLEWRSW